MINILILFIGFLIYSCAKSLNPSNEDTAKGQYHYELGMSSFLLKNYSEAIANFNKAAQLMPKDPKVWNALGVAYTEVEDYEKAESAFLRALQIDKKFSETYLNRGIMYFKRKDYEKAQENLIISINDETFDKRHIAYYYLAKVYQQMGNNEAYVNNLIKASLYNPNFLEAQIELAKFYEENKDYNKAADVYLRLLNQNPQIDPKLKLDAAKTMWLSGNTAISKSIISDLLKERNLDQNTAIQAKSLLDQLLISEHNQRHILLLTNKEASINEESSKQKEDQNLKLRGTDTKEDQKKEDKKSKLDDEPRSPFKEKAFYVQLAAFSIKTNAELFKKKLKEVTAIDNIIIYEKDNLYKVMLGPYNSKVEAEKDLSKIRKLKLDGIIVSE